MRNGLFATVLSGSVIAGSAFGSDWDVLRADRCGGGETAPIQLAESEGGKKPLIHLAESEGGKKPLSQLAETEGGKKPPVRSATESDHIHERREMNA